MCDLRLTLVQANQVWENKELNYTNYENLLDGVQTDLIILPEMFNTAFSMNIESLSEEWGNSNAIKWLQKTADKYNAAVYTSLIIRDGESVFNRAVFVLPSGEIEYYDKRKSFGLAKEDQFFTAGDKEVIVNYKGWKIQLQICYDLRFPELVRNKIMTNNTTKYDLLLYVANWPEKRISHWDCLLTARAIENQCYVAGVNRVGSDQNDLNYCGHSKLVDALGQESILTNNTEEVHTITIQKEKLEKVRNSLPFLRDR